MFNDKLELISYSIVPDEIGNQKKVKASKTILCSVQSATRTEFYNYGDSELRPEYVVTINSCEYEDETLAFFRDKQYTITRTYKSERDLLELTLSRSIQR